MEKGKKIWDSLGTTDPYFAVYSVEKYLDSNLNEDAKDDFFSSGFEYVEKLWADFEGSLVTNLSPSQCSISDAA